MGHQKVYLSIFFKYFKGEDLYNDCENINKKGLEVICRIRDKLSGFFIFYLFLNFIGKDFKNVDPISINKQIKLLINQATAIENLCEAYIGWSPLL